MTGYYTRADASAAQSGLSSSYTVRLKEVLDDGASLGVAALTAVEVDRNYVRSLRVGDSVSLLEFTARVREISPAENPSYYYLDNGLFIYLGKEGDGLLLYSMEQPVTREGEEWILPVSPDFFVHDANYAYNLGHYEEIDTPWTLRQILDRYGPDLGGHQIHITVVDGVITEGSIGVYD